MEMPKGAFIALGGQRKAASFQWGQNGAERGGGDGLKAIRKLQGAPRILDRSFCGYWLLEHCWDQPKMLQCVNNRGFYSANILIYYQIIRIQKLLIIVVISVYSERLIHMI